MLKCAGDDCPQVLTSGRVAEDIRKVCRDKSFVPADFVETCILEQAGTEVMNRVK